MEKILAIALTTYRESVRSKVLYSVIFFAGVMLAISTFFGTVTIGDQVKVIKDFGLFCVSLFTVAYAVISGSSLLYKELSKKTIYNILAKPVGRYQFLVGKFLGMWLTTIVMVSMMGTGLMLYLYFFEGRFDFNLIKAFLYNILELSIICAATIFFSSIVVTPVLIGLFSFGIFLAGRSSQYLNYFIEQISVEGSPIKLLQYILPNLDALNISDGIVYGNLSNLSDERFLWSVLYALSYAGILLILANLIFRRREFN